MSETVGVDQNDDVITVAGVTFNRATGELSSDAGHTNLGKGKRSQLLFLLLQNINALVSYEDIERMLYHQGLPPEGVIKVFVSNIRRSLQIVAGSRLRIEPVMRKGYTLKEIVSS